MARERTTKALAKRIELDYWSRPHAWRTAMARATLLVPALLTIWLMGAAYFQGEHVFNSGPVSTRHAMFGRDCLQCHESWNGTPDAKCVTCHEAPLHHANQTQTPECASCHVEHKGHQVLARVSDAHCSRCHDNLETLTGPSKFVSGIKSFSAGHPEFRILKEQGKDTTALRFNHKLHLKANLQGPDGCVTLECTQCHVPDVAGRYMPVPTFDKHCKSCHPLLLGMALPGGLAPHDKPETVDEAVRAALSKLCAQHPEKMKDESADSGSGRRRRGGSAASAPATPVSTADWIAKKTAEIEKTLFDKGGQGCKLCHEMKPKTGSLPGVAPTTIPARWLPHSVFSHRSHRPLTCLVCHGAAVDGTETSDVMLPTRAICATCHSPEGGARSTCAECHAYHDKTKDLAFDGPMKIAPLEVKQRRR